MLEGLSIAALTPIIAYLGLPGLIFIVWYVDQKRLDKVMARNKEDMTKVITRNKEDMAKVVRMYEDNVILVKGYERLAADLTGIIHLNTQVQTNLVNSIKNNHWCPVARERQGD
jgi:hypothetical protein